MKKWKTGNWLLLIAALTAVFFLVPVINEFIPQKVNVKYVSFDGVKTMAYDTRAHKLDEFFSEHADEVRREDVVEGFTDAKLADTFVKNEMDLTVIKADDSKAKIGGRKQDLYIYPGTVAETLKYNSITYDEDDKVEPALDSEMADDTTIKITRVKIKTKNKVLEIPPEEKGAVFDSSLSSGTIVRTEGKPGKAVYEYTYKYINGKKVKTTREFVKWKKEPEHIRLTFGTSVTGETGSVDYSETFIGECTAYYFGNSATGAIGQRCHYGTCAVDPSVIPYGTKLYVEGYGTAIANDCGGAVKGHIIDLYMRSTKECFQWGRRNRKVYVLK